MAANPAGRIAFAVTQKGVVAGVVIERSPARTAVIVASGDREVWGNDRVFFVADARAPLHSARAAADALAAFVERVDETRAGIDLATTWDLLSDDPAPRGVADFAELSLGRAGPEETAAAAWALAEDDSYFRRSGDDAWQPYPRDAVEAARRRRQREAQERDQADRVADAIRDLLDLGAPFDGRDAAARTGVAWLKELALAEPDGKEGARGAAVLERLRGGAVSSPQIEAFRTLVALRVFDEDEILGVHRNRIRLAFPPEVAAEAERIAAAGRPDAEMADRVALAPGLAGAIAIDDPWTTEVDDALMVEPAGDATRVHVLIADPSAAVPLASAVGQEGMARAATLYLPAGKVPMLPPILSEGPLSLLPDGPRPMLDFACTVGADGRVSAFRVAPVVAAIDRRLTYEAVDALLAAGDAGGASDPATAALSRLRGLADAVRARRVEAGAVLVERDEISVRVENGEVVLRRLPWESPARRLVAEFMVLACTQAGAFARANGIPTVYRRQNPPDDRNATQGLKPGTRAFAYRMVRTLRRAELTTNPDFHFGLGVVGYTQVTSPLRRFQDFIEHVQLKGFLRTGRAPLDTDALLRVFGELEGRAEALTQVEREAKRYFTLKYLKRFENQDVAGEVVAALGSRGIVSLDETGLELPVAGAGHLALGTRVVVRVREVDPRRDRVTLGLG